MREERTCNNPDCSSAGIICEHNPDEGIFANFCMECGKPLEKIVE